MGRISNKHRRALKKIKAHALDDNSYLDKEKDDEIDAFHKQREMIPLDFNKDIKFSDDDAEEPIFDLKAKHNGDRYNGRDDDEEDDKDDEDFTDAEDKGFAAKIARQLKYLKERFGGVEDEMSDDDKSDEERNIAWGRNMNLYYGADNIDYELQSSDEDLLMEEKEVMKIERGRAKILVKEDFGLESSDEEGNFVCGKISQVLAKKRPTTKRGANFIDGIADLNPVSKKDRMDLLCRLVTLDDFDDMARHSKHHGSASGPQSSNKLVLTARTKKNGWKILSGDEDAPKRDDIGERRGKQELRAPSRGGVTDAGKKDYCSAGIYGQGNNFQKSGKIESEDEFYRGVKKQRTEKLAAKEKPYAGPQLVPEEEHPSVGRRPIPREIQQNRGLTRYRKKLTKNPRKKYKIKHQNAMMHRKGQVRDIRRPTGSYGGEPTGININVSRSIRFKN